MLPVRFGGPYHSALLDLGLLCRLNSPRHPGEVVGAVLLLSYEVPQVLQDMKKEGKY